MTDDRVTRIGVPFKAPPDGKPMLDLVVYEPGGCDHRSQVRDGRIVHASYRIREGETEVECSLCGTRLDPMFVLKILASAENRWSETRKNYQAEMARLAERRRTKCEHCQRMTRIRQ